MVSKKTVHEKVIREVIEKPAKKKTSKKRKSAKRKNLSPKKSETDKRIETALVENFISLQKVMTNISVKFDNLSGQISKLLELFEISAKALAEKDFGVESEKKETKDLIEKLDSLADQNKIIAKGLALVHDRMNEEEEIPFSRHDFSPRPMVPRQIAPMPRPEMPKPKMNSPIKPLNSFQDDSMNTPPETSFTDDGYQRSISSNTNESNKKSF